MYGAYKAINETPGVSAALQLQPPETATTVRVQDGTTLTTDGPFVALKEVVGGYRAGLADRRDPHGRRDRGAPDRGAAAILDQAFRDQWRDFPRARASNYKKL